MKTKYRWVLTGEKYRGSNTRRWVEGVAQTVEQAEEDAGFHVSLEPRYFGEGEFEVYKITESLLKKSRFQGGKVVPSHLPINSQK